MKTVIERAITSETRQMHYASDNRSVLVTLGRRPGQHEWRFQSVGVLVGVIVVRHYMGLDPIPDDLAPYVEHALSIARAEQ